MKNYLNTIILAALLVLGFGATIFSVRKFTEPPKGAFSAVEFSKKLATNFESRALWDLAAQEYAKLLQNQDIDQSDRAKISYHLGEIYFEKLSEPEAALPYLFAAKTIEGDSELGKKTDRLIVASFERSGRSLDAANYLSGAASIDGQPPQPTDPNDIVLAKVGNKLITARDLTNQIQRFPAQLQEQYKVPSKKLELLQNMVAKDMLLIAAKRAGYDKDPQIESTVRLARDAAVLKKYEEQEIDQKIRPTDADVRAYYESHKSEFTYVDENNIKKQSTFEQSKDRAAALYEAQRRRELVDEILNRIHQSEGVEIYSDRLDGIQTPEPTPPAPPPTPAPQIQPPAPAPKPQPPVQPKPQPPVLKPQPKPQPPAPKPEPQPQPEPKPEPSAPPSKPTPLPQPQ